MGQGYRLSGEKQMIALAPVADFGIVFGTVNKDAGAAIVHQLLEIKRTCILTCQIGRMQR